VNVLLGLWRKGQGRTSLQPQRIDLIHPLRFVLIEEVGVAMVEIVTPQDLKSAFLRSNSFMQNVVTFMGITIMTEGAVRTRIQSSAVLMLVTLSQSPSMC
jgi:hypothetical protein